MDNETINIIATDGVTKTNGGSDDHTRAGLVIMGLALVGGYVVGKKVLKVVDHMRYRKFYKK